MAAVASHPAVAAVKRSFEAAPSDGDDTELEQREETDVGTDKEPDSKPAPPVDPKARYKSLRIRTISTIAVLAITGAFIYSGHVPLMCLVIVLQVLITKEIFAMGTVAQKERRLPWFRAQQWYFYFVANFFLYLRFIKNNLLVELSSDHRLARLGYLILKHHSFISYSLYMAGFVTFVLSLKRNMYVYQFTQYAWTHMIMLVVLVPSTFLVSNIFVGIMWFLFPCYLIVMNDIAAYLAGFFFGRTPLIQLSPKKTWEGFIGGALTTIGAAYLLGGFMSQFDWMICPRLDLSVFGPLHCEREALYIPRRFTLADVSGALPQSLTEYVATLAAIALPPPAVERLAGLSFVAMPMQLHAMVLAVFASLIAPFGGFFASGFKRAFKQKDFGDTIPGHGGITDRFDCQIIMGMFAYIYYWNCAAAPQVSVGEVLHTALKLGDAAQVELFVKLGNLLVGEGLLPESVGKTLARVMSAAVPS